MGRGPEGCRDAFEEGEGAMKEGGLLFHAKHAYMPNSLGYCGPDDRGRILQHLEVAKGGEDLVSTLKEFEAAYPFLRLIAKASGKDPFDYSVPEAYWIGNSLLDKVPASDFYGFSHRELKGRDPGEVRRVFKALDGSARPHHTFYVMSTYASSSVADGPRSGVDRDEKVGNLIDSCRVSWGTVRKVGEETLGVEYRPIVLKAGKISLAPARLKEVAYIKYVKPFGSVKRGDVVSMHWGYACEVLTPRQARNVRLYTELDLASANRLLAAGVSSRE